MCTEPGYWRASRLAGDFPRRASPISKSPPAASRLFWEPSRSPPAACSSQPPMAPLADTPPLAGSSTRYSGPPRFSFFSPPSLPFGHTARGTRLLLCKGLSCLLRPRLTAAYIALHGDRRLDRLGRPLVIQWDGVLGRVFASRRRIGIWVLHWEVGRAGARNGLHHLCSRSTVSQLAGWSGICLL